MAFSEASATVRRGGIAGLWLPMTQAACLLPAGSAATARETYKRDPEDVGAHVAEPSGSGSGSELAVSA